MGEQVQCPALSSTSYCALRKLETAHDGQCASSMNLPNGHEIIPSTTCSRQSAKNEPFGSDKTQQEHVCSSKKQVITSHPQPSFTTLVGPRELAPSTGNMLGKKNQAKRSNFVTWWGQSSTFLGGPS
jgi:hypothetical protein